MALDCSFVHRSGGEGNKEEVAVTVVMTAISGQLRVPGYYTSHWIRDYTHLDLDGRGTIPHWCTMYTVHCTVYNVQSTVYNVQCSL